MSKSEKYLVLGATEYNMVTKEDKLHSMAEWFYVHYPHKTKNKAKIRVVRKRAGGNSTYEENNKIYIVP